VLLKPLPYAKADEIYGIEIVVPELREQIPSLPATVQAYLAWRNSGVGSGITALRPWECTFTGDGEPERLGGARVSPNFFTFLGVPPAAGRGFSTADGEPGREGVVIISDGLWRRRYGANPSVVGRTVTINGQPHTVIGVAPPSLVVPTGMLLHPLVAFAPRVDVWKPIAPTAGELKNESWDHGVLIRVPPTNNLEQVRGALAGSVTELMRAQRPGVRTEPGIRLVPLREVFSAKSRLRLLLIFAASLVLLVTACVNTTNLFLARTTSRAGEFATRIALGAGRARIFSQTITETVLIAAAGGMLGGWMAAYGAALLSSSGPEEVRLLAAGRVDWELVIFAIGASVAAGLLCGIIPAWHAARPDVAHELREAGRNASGGPPRARFMLIGVEMMLATALLASAGLLLHSFVRIIGADRGYQVERILAVELSLSGPDYAMAGRRVTFYEQLAANVSNLRGVDAAGAISDLPAIASGVGGSRIILYDTDTRLRDVMLTRPVAMIRSVTPGYFAASGSQLRAGRSFGPQEQTLVGVINESLARRLWPNDPPEAIIGRSIRQGDAATPLVAIIGIVRDARPGAIDRPEAAALYRPHAQWASGPMTLVVRTAGDPASVAQVVRAAIRKMDANLPIPALRTMREIVSASVAERRFQMLLTLAFAVVALMLGAVGLYGVVSYAIACRTRDIGIRMALGAVRGDVMRWVFATGMKPAIVGLVAGIAAAVAIARLLRNLLYGIRFADPLALGAVTGVLLAASALACYVPARRAAALDPLAALRHD
jgi:putative ABC transport system permease protein